jgi:hypothetical protein
MGRACSAHDGDEHTTFWLQRLKERERDNNIKSDLKDVDLEVVDWTNVPQDRDGRWSFVNTVMDNWNP